jgi:Calcineurin-like phosphoesterase
MRLLKSPVMRLVLISDTHCKRPDVPLGDVLIHAGDISHLGSFAEFKAEAAWLKSLPHKQVLMVPGNHDCCVFNLIEQNMEPKLRQFLNPISYLRDSGVETDGLKFWGTPWVPENSGGDFCLPSDQLTHCPAYGILDSEDGEHKGSPELRHVLRSLPKLKLHVCGHIHASAGIEQRDGVTFVNAAAKLTGKPFVVDIGETQGSALANPRAYTTAAS